MPLEDFEKRLALTRRLSILGGITLVVSIIAIVIGIFSVSVTITQMEFPFTAGGAMIAGIPALFLSCCPMQLYRETKKSRGGYPGGYFYCCTVIMVVWFAITILAIILGSGLSGIYGVISCSNEELKLKACSSYTESKIAISVVTIIVTLVLFVLSLAIFFTCCCNSAAFGIPLLNSSYSYGYYDGSVERMRYSRPQQDFITDGTLPEATQNRSPTNNRINDNHVTIIEPSAPMIDDARLPDPEVDTRLQYMEVDEIGETGATSTGRAESLHDEPPPSYDEVMAKEQTLGTAV